MNEPLKNIVDVRNSDVRTVLQSVSGVTQHLTSVSTVPTEAEWLALVTLVTWGVLSPVCVLLRLRGHAGLAVIVSTWKRAWLLKCIFSPEKKPEFEDKSRSSKPHTRTKTSIFSFSSPNISSSTHILISQRQNSFSPAQKCNSFITEMYRTQNALYHFQCDTSQNSIMGKLHQIQWSIFKGSWGNKVYKMP